VHMILDSACIPVSGTADKMFCARHRTEATCISHRGNGSRTGYCSWRRLQELYNNDYNNDNASSVISSLYETCSPDLSTCPNQRCDELEMTIPTLCPQDCISTSRYHSFR